MLGGYGWSYCLEYFGLFFKTMPEVLGIMPNL
jgi:hypothetical protein